MKTKLLGGMKLKFKFLKLGLVLCSLYLLSGTCQDLKFENNNLSLINLMSKLRSTKLYERVTLDILNTSNRSLLLFGNVVLEQLCLDYPSHSRAREVIVLVRR
jgi:hypothetical protein